MRRQHELAEPPADAVRVISNNCWGMDYAKRQAAAHAKPYATPFLGLFMHAPCYLTMLEHLDEYLAAPLTAASSSRYGTVDYPVAKWLAAEVHFVHSASIEEAIATFERRRRRFLAPEAAQHPILVKLDDRDSFCDALAERFRALPFSAKVLVLSRRHRHLASTITSAAPPTLQGRPAVQSHPHAQSCATLLLEDEETPDGRVLEFGVSVTDVLHLTSPTNKR